MDNDQRRGLPEILARLRREAEMREAEPTPPAWARPAGWLLAVAIVAVVVVMIVTANPL